MSINSLANSATARRPDFLPVGSVPANRTEIAAAAATPPTPGHAAPANARMAVVPGRVDTTFNVLFGYIPTEVLTLYVAVLAAFEGDHTSPVRWAAFLVFLFATPVILWVVYATKLRGEGKALPLRPRYWPVWEMVAATFAYFAWAFALPETPFANFAWYSPALTSCSPPCRRRSGR